MTSPRRVLRSDWPLFVEWIRATILQDTFHKARDKYLRRAKVHRKDLVPFNQPGLEVVTFLELWFASLQGVMEGYERASRSGPVPFDPAVAKLLTSNRRRELRRFRSDLFHIQARNHRQTIAVLKQYKKFIEWANMLVIQLGVAILARGLDSRARKAGRLTSA